MAGNPKTDPVTAKIIFSGVMLACINSKKQYEVGMVRCPNHDPKITVLTKVGDKASKELVVWPLGHDLKFDVINPDEEGVSKYPTDDRDLTFDRVIDLESPDLHSEGVTVNTDRLQGRRLAVTAGRLYSDRLTDVDFTLLSWTDENDPGAPIKFVGKIARDVGLNIVCRNEANSGIRITDLDTGEVIRQLPMRDDTSYQILIDNDCRKAGGTLPDLGTDFRYLYSQDLVTSSDGVKYDLGYGLNSNEENSDADSEPINAAHPPLASPDACENTFLSHTSTLGTNS